MPPMLLRIRTLAVTHVRFVYVLEQRIALCLVSFLCVSARQAFVESVLDRKPDSGASLSLLTPAKNQQRIQPFEQLPRDLLDLVALLGRQRRSGTHQDIEDGQFFFAQVLAHVPPLLLGQHPRQREQVPEDLLDVSAAAVVGVDQFLELLQMAKRASAKRRKVRPRTGVEYCPAFSPEFARNWSAAAHKRFSSVSLAVSFSDGATQRM
jgi:hypothetical protein